jgi:hypothetical protein
MNVTVELDVRSVRIFKRNKADEITGAFVRKFVDVAVTTTMTTGGTYSEVFTAHVFRGELRVKVRGTSAADRDRSMRFEEFCEFATARWKGLAGEVVRPIASQFI